MGKDNKTKAADKKARVAAKQEKKAKTSERKAKTNPKKRAAAAADDSDAEDNVNLDAILAEFQKNQELHLKVTEATNCEPPRPRSASTIIASPTDAREIFLFGGELYNGALATFNNDLYIYRIPTDEWRKVTSPNSPLPRSGHAMCRGANNGLLYLFGGEFSSPRQSIFHHFHDFWSLDPSNREWTRIEPPQKKSPTPSARSGHRMVPFKRYIILYGGFQDTSQTTKYLNDLWIYDCLTFAWHQPVLPPAAGKPDARSSFSFLPHDLGAVLFGGYARIKSAVSVSHKKSGKPGTASRVVLSPVVYQDAWILKIVPPAPDAPLHTLPTVRWERRKRPAGLPAPSRAGATMVHHKGRGILFGGVHDVEASEEGIESEFFNGLYGYGIDRNRFFALNIRKPRAAGGKKASGGGGGGGGERTARRGQRGKADEEELLRNLKLLEARGSLAGGADVDMAELTGGDDGDLDSDADNAHTKIEKPVAYEFPHPRFNAQLAVQNDVLYIYGGTYEKGDREFTFDEMYSIDLGKLDGTREIFRRDVDDWQGSEDESSDDDDDDDEDDDGASDSGSDDDNNKTAINTDPAPKPALTKSPNPVTPAPGSTAAPAADPAQPEENEEDEEEEEEEKPAPTRDPSIPYPRPFETLREFFSRTNIAWQDAVLEKLAFAPRGQGVETKSGKEIRADAFERAEAEWWDCREEMQVLEDERDDAGIGDVVSLDSRGGEGGGSAAGPRRR